MKNSFRIAVLLLLVILVAINLMNRKSYQSIVVANAEKEIVTIPVTVLEVSPSSQNLTIRASGKVQSTKEIIVLGTVAGEIRQILVKPGQAVKMGQLLAVIDDYYLREQWELARQAFQQDTRDLERLKALEDVDAVTGQQLEQFQLKVEAAKTKMNLAKKRLGEANVTAPSAGVVNQIFASVGNLLGPGRPLCEIVGDEVKIIKAGVEERYLTFLQIGMPVRLLDFDVAYPISSQILSLGVKANRLGLVPLELSFGDNDLFHQGLIVDIEIDAPIEQGFFIPRSAIRRETADNYLFVAENGKATKRKVLIGKPLADKIEVIEGLKGGEKIILRGNHLLKDNDSIKVVNQEN